MGINIENVLMYRFFTIIGMGGDGEVVSTTKTDTETVVETWKSMNSYEKKVYMVGGGVSVGILDLNCCKICALTT